MHGRRLAARLLAAAAVLTFGLGQFVASWHEATVQHVRCAEHGELTHVSLSHHAPSPTLRRNTIDSSEFGTIDGHEHCGFVFARRDTAPTKLVRVAVRFTPPPAVAQQPVDPLPSIGRRAFVLASAPKTSPPSA
jgi:hypothetical protein